MFELFRTVHRVLRLCNSRCPLKLWDCKHLKNSYKMIKIKKFLKLLTLEIVKGYDFITERQSVKN